MNQFTFSGRLTKDASINPVGNTKVINFTTAVDVGYGERKKTLFVDCARFSDNTKVSEYLLKGQQVIVSGEADLRVWESNGKNAANITCRVNNVELVGSKVVAQPGYNDAAIQQQKQDERIDSSEEFPDLPF